MRKSMLCAALAVAFLALGPPVAPSAMQRPDRPAIEPVAQQVVCVGDRRSYRSFNHCWAVNIRRSRPNAVSRYCSRICQ